MKPEIFGSSKNSNEKKPVNLRLIPWNGGDDVMLACVDNNGEFVASLIRFMEDGRAVADVGAEKVLLHEDYDTSFAEWDEEGAIVIKPFVGII